MSSISNMPIEEAGLPAGDTGYVWDVYQDSLKMSTYLLAFVVSDFVYRTPEPLSNGVEFRVWSREDISSILIGRAPTMLRSHWSRASCTAQSYAIKNQIVAKIPPTWGISCSSLVLYGIRELA